MATSVVPVRTKAPVQGRDIAAQVRKYIEEAARPMLVEAGSAPFALTPESWELVERGNTVLLHAWSERSNLSRRITAVLSSRPDQMTLRTEVFGGRTGTLTIYDAGRPSTRNHDRRGARLELRERFRRFLRRQFPEMKVADLSAEANLENTLSPNFPRALLKKGGAGWAAIGAPDEASIVDEVLSFGLIWLDYLRRRDTRLAIEGLVLYLPAGLERTTSLRLHYLSGAKWSAWAYAEEGFEAPLDMADYGNLDTSVAICRSATADQDCLAPLLEIPGTECLPWPDGSIRIRVRGLELARLSEGELLWTFDSCLPRRCTVDEIAPLAEQIAGIRCHDTADRRNRLYLRNPELWLESQVRAAIEQISPDVLPSPVYGQVPGITGTAHGIIDLLACRRDGRLVIIEMKAAEDIHLPLQALDYWMRIRWHAERGDFSRNGYFPGVRIRPEAPRLLLIAPALQFHPTNDVVLRYFSPEVTVERIGVGLEWQRKLQVMLGA